MSKKLHILFLCGWYPSRVLPTNGDFIQRHAEAVSLKHKVSVLHIISDSNLKEDFEISENKTGTLTEYIAYIKSVKNPILKSYFYIKAYQKLLNKINTFDIVHLNSTYPFGIFALHLKWFYRTPYIISEHWSGYHLPQSKEIGLIQKFISKMISSNSSFISPVSNDLAKSMKTFGLKGNYKRVPNVVDTDLFVPGEKTSEDFTVLHISSMVDIYKNVTGILNVVSELQKYAPTFKMKFIGESSQDLIPKAKELGIDLNQCLFIDQLPHTEIINQLQNADCLLLFSNYENLPCVILEAFSTGTPVISTDVGGITEFFPENFGVLIEKGNEKMLLNTLQKVYNKEISFSTSNMMHKYAVTHFSRKKICEDFSELYYLALNN